MWGAELTSPGMSANWLAGDGLTGVKRGDLGRLFEGGNLAGAALLKFSPTNASRISRNNSVADQLRALFQVSVTRV